MPNARYVYAIVGRGTPLPATRAGAAAELAAVSWRELAAVTRETGSGSAPLTMEAVLHHEAVVEAVRRQGPALPVRFGTVFRDATSVASALAEQYEPLAADLDRLGDKVELSLTALWAAPDGDGAARAPVEARAATGHGAGARYLRARAAEVRRGDALKERAAAVARELDEVLGGLALERRVSLLQTPRIAVRTAYLMAPAGVSAFRAAFEAVRGSSEELRLLLTGPWPPYSFVRRTAAESVPAANGRFEALARVLIDEMRGRGG